MEVECGAVRLESHVEDEMQLCTMSWVAHMHMLQSGLGLQATCMGEEQKAFALGRFEKAKQSREASEGSDKTRGGWRCM